MVKIEIEVEDCVYKTLLHSSIGAGSKDVPDYLSKLLTAVIIGLAGNIDNPGHIDELTRPILQDPIMGRAYKKAFPGSGL